MKPESPWKEQDPTALSWRPTNSHVLGLQMVGRSLRHNVKRKSKLKFFMLGLVIGLLMAFLAIKFFPKILLPLL